MNKQPTTPCANHPTREAKMYDLDAQGKQVPLCEACAMARWRQILDRTSGRKLIAGGVRG